MLRSFARDLVSSLSYTHSEGVVFCDLKPGNILLNEYSNLKLCDFGLSQRVVDMVEGEDKSSKDDKQGTPYYMAPELFDSLGVYSFASDIYSLGVVLYELASGKTPFNDENFADLVKKVCEEQPKPLSNVSPECNGFIMMLLEKNPVKRPKWSDICSHSWWGGIKFQAYDYPAETHFERFIEERGLNKVEDTQVDMIEESLPERSKLNASRVSLQTEQILRMSQNIQKNLNRDQGGFNDHNDEQSTLKLDKNRTVNMGTKTNVVVEVTEEISKSQEASSNANEESRSKLSITQDLSIQGSQMKENRSPKYNGPVLITPKLNPATAHLLDILIVPSDRTAKPIMANPEIEKLEDFDYTTPSEGVKLLKPNDILSLQKDQLDAYFSDVYQIAASNSNSKERMNILNYFVTIIQGSDIANIVVESFFMNLFAKLLKTVKVKNLKVMVYH